MKYLLIESVEADGTEWGVSRNGPNPELADYIACKTDADAVRLLEWLERGEKHTTDLLRNGEQESEKYRKALASAKHGFDDVVELFQRGEHFSAEERAEREAKYAAEVLA